MRCRIILGDREEVNFFLASGAERMRSEPLVFLSGRVGGLSGSDPYFCLVLLFFFTGDGGRRGSLPDLDLDTPQLQFAFGRIMSLGTVQSNFFCLLRLLIYFLHF